MHLNQSQVQVTFTIEYFLPPFKTDQSNRDARYVDWTKSKSFSMCPRSKVPSYLGGVKCKTIVVNSSPSNHKPGSHSTLAFCNSLFCVHYFYSGETEQNGTLSSLGNRFKNDLKFPNIVSKRSRRTSLIRVFFFFHL